MTGWRGSDGKTHRSDYGKTTQMLIQPSHESTAEHVGLLFRHLQAAAAAAAAGRDTDRDNELSYPVNSTTASSILDSLRPNFFSAGQSCAQCCASSPLLTHENRSSLMTWLLRAPGRPSLHATKPRWGP
ncbi:hypothetical protein PAMP_020877 [Pampus punctatissimus]